LAVSTPIFTTKAAFFRIFQALHFFLCTIPDFCDFSSLRTVFLAKFGEFCGFSQKRADFENLRQTDFENSDFRQILKILTDFLRNFAQFLQFCIE